MDAIAALHARTQQVDAELRALEQEIVRIDEQVTSYLNESWKLQLLFAHHLN